MMNITIMNKLQLKKYQVKNKFRLKAPKSKHKI